MITVIRLVVLLLVVVGMIVATIVSTTIANILNGHKIRLTITLCGSIFRRLSLPAFFEIHGLLQWFLGLRV